MSKYVFLILQLLLFFDLNGQIKPSIIAHRGAKSIAPENTLSAFAAAINMGVDFIELDVRKSLDDSLMVMHDSTVDRTTNFSGGLNTFTYTQLKNMDAGSYFSNEFIGEPIPSLYEILNYAKGKTKICIELKDPNIETQTVNMIQQLNLVHDVVLFSFDLNQLQLIKSINASIEVCYLQHQISLSDIDDLININGEYVGSGGEPAISSILYANYFGVDFWNWTINSSEKMKFIMTQGMNGIITDYPQDAICLKTLLMNQGLIANWNFDNNAGNAIDDATGNLNNGSTHNTSWTNGINGSCLHFNGTNSYATFYQSSVFNSIDKSVSIAAWVNLNHLPSQISSSFGPIFDSDQDAYILYLDKANGELRFKVKDINGHVEIPAIPESYLDTNTWHHVAGVCNGKDVLIYLDGQLMDNQSSSSLDTLITNQLAEIGRNNGHYFDGKLDELKIYNRALTPYEVEMLAQQTSYFCNDTTQVVLPYDSILFPIYSDLASCESVEINCSSQKNINTSIEFGGVIDYININSTAPGLSNYSHSFFSWIKTPTGLNDQRIFSINTYTGGNVSLFGIYNDKLNIFNDGNYYSGTTTINDDQWHYVGYSWNSNTNTLIFFVDGNSDGTFSNIDLKSSKTDIISLGQEFDGLSASNKFSGQMMHVSVWKNAITVSEQLDMYLNGITPSHPKYIYLIGHYMGQTNCSNQLHDYSSYQNHGLSYPIINYQYDTITNYNFSNTTHQWITQSGQVLSDSNVLAHTLYQNEKIIFNQSNISGQIFTDSFDVIVHTPNQLNLGLDTIICLGENILIQADTTFSNFSWSNNTNLSQFYFESNLYGTGNHQISVHAVDENYCDVYDSLIIEVLDCSSIDEVNNGDILIYPIPSSKVLHIRTTDGDRLLEAKIYTTNGELIKKCITQPIAISNLNSGMYFIEIKTLKIDKLQKKIVVNQQ